MADVAYRTGTPTSAFSFGAATGGGGRHGMGILIAPIQALSYTVSSIRVAFAHRQPYYGDTSHGTVSTISCYIADNIALGTTAFPAALVSADNTILDTEVSEFAYGVYDGTYSLHTFVFSTQPTLTGQNWIIISQIPAGDFVREEFTFSVGWSPTGGTPNGIATGVTYIRATTWQQFTTMLHYVDVYGAFIIPRDPDRPDADIVPFPPTRPDDYNPDLIWTPDVNPIPGNPSTWQEPGVGYQAAGGGHWNQQLVVAGNKKVYYEAL